MSLPQGLVRSGYFRECADIYKWKAEIAQKSESQLGFVPQSGRWLVERSFAWFNFFQRWSRDYEKTVECSVAFVHTAFIDMILSLEPFSIFSSRYGRSHLKNILWAAKGYFGPYFVAKGVT